MNASEEVQSTEAPLGNTVVTTEYYLSEIDRLLSTANHTPARPGRPQLPSTKQLVKVTTLDDNPGKGEYMRLMQIRLTSKVIRLFLEEIKQEESPLSKKKAKMPKSKSESRLEQLKVSQPYKLARMKELIQIDKEAFEHIKNVDQLRAKYRSFNNDFCMEYFASESVVEFYQWLVDAVFEGATPGDLCSQFKKSCCQLGNHTDACEEAWTGVWIFLKVGMLKRLFSQKKINPPTFLGTEPDITETPGKLPVISICTDEEAMHIDDYHSIKPLSPPSFELQLEDARSTMESLYGEVYEKPGFLYPSIN